MELLESLKAAKAFLNAVENNPTYKTNYICFALYDAFAAKYGAEKLHTEYESGVQLRKARGFVVERLWELQAEHGLLSTDSFDNDLAIRYLGEETADTQVARHAWLDALIRELEDAESN